MKKTFAVLMLAAMLLSAGCGNTMDGAKKDAQEAQQKVEQTANEAKDAANAKVDEAKDKANEAKDAANAKVDEAKDAANQAVDATKDAANKAADEAAAKVDEAKDAAAGAMTDAANIAKDAADTMNSAIATAEGRTIALGGLMPGAAVEDITAMFGEATSVNGKVMNFVDGLKVTLDDANKVKEISTTGNAFDTPDGMYVGASEYLLNDYCGPADAVRKIDNGAEYEYNGGDKKSKVVYKSQNGVITEITCSVK